MLGLGVSSLRKTHRITYFHEAKILPYEPRGFATLLSSYRVILRSFSGYMEVPGEVSKVARAAAFAEYTASFEGSKTVMSNTGQSALSESIYYKLKIV